MNTDNKKLHKAKDGKKDEFYTQRSDIEKELQHYNNYFKEKVILCNCDDPNNSNFVRYFLDNFEKLGLKKLIAIGYKTKPEKGVYLEYTGNKNNIKYLNGDGDFRSTECIEFLKESDIVITNPPFSLFREYVNQLVDYNKKFIIIGHQNAITYKEIFKLIKENKIWLGYGFNRNCAHFINEHYEDYASDLDHKSGMIRVSGVQWFTNMDITKRHEIMVLCKKYNPEEYEKYENYDGINVNKTQDIPINYYGNMGVPITFLNKYNPDQFEIIKFRKGDDNKDLSINGKCPYFRILIRKK